MQMKHASCPWRDSIAKDQKPGFHLDVRGIAAQTISGYGHISSVFLHPVAHTRPILEDIFVIPVMGRCSFAVITDGKGHANAR